jgi:DNA-binding NarL/FixJ family response regulator
MKSRADQIKRVGVVSSDPLRVVGLQAILEDREEDSQQADGDSAPHPGFHRFEVIPLSVPGALGLRDLRVVLLDSRITPHLLALLDEFVRSERRLRVLVLGPEAQPEFIEALVAAGARGYLADSASEREVCQAVTAVSEGSVWASRRVMSRLLDRAPAHSATESAAIPKLTPREREVLGLLARGYPNREIGNALGVDEGTVKAHVGRLMRKVGVVNRTALTMWMLQHRFSS